MTTLPTMGADEYRAAIKTLGLSQRQAGAFLGRNEKTSRRWARYGDVPTAETNLLRLMVAQGKKPGDL